MSYKHHQTSAESIVKALRLLLKPLVRLLIRQQLSFPFVRELLKQLYVEQAAELIEQDGQSVNFSRLFILSGVHRKDIKRLTDQADDEAETSENRSLGGMLIARWLGLPQYQTTEGKPRKLPFNGTQQEPGFEQLLSEVSKDIRPRALLDEWLRQGIVSQHQDLIELNTAAFIPTQDFAQMSDFFGKQLHDHLAASVHNLMDDGEPMLERSVYYAHLTPESIAQLKQLAEIQADELLQDLNQRALELYVQDKDNPAATGRFRLGCYWYDEEKPS